MSEVIRSRTEMFPTCPKGSKRHELRTIGQRTYSMAWSAEQDLLVAVVFCADCERTLATHVLGLQNRQAGEGSPIELASHVPDPRITSELLSRMRK